MSGIDMNDRFRAGDPSRNRSSLIAMFTRSSSSAKRGLRRPAVVAGCVLVALIVAWYAGAQSPPPAPTPSVGSVRLGPEPGEDVAAYVARLPDHLPPAGTRALSLVQFDTELAAADALAVTAGATPVTAVFRVPFERVQTALRFVPLDPNVAPADALDQARIRALRDAEAAAAQSRNGDGQPTTDRAAAVADAEARALARPECRCLPALLVDADRAALDAIAARPGVRAVDAAPPGVTVSELALAPLLPEQTERADPLPDDGPVPPSRCDAACHAPGG